MNYSFSFPRLWQLILKQGMENARFYFLYALATLGVTGLLVSFWLFKSDKQYHEGDLYEFLFIALFLCGTLFASLQFEPLAKKAGGIYWLSFPASHLEKLICAAFYTLIVFNVLFFVCFLLARGLVVTYIITSVVPEGGAWVALDSPFRETGQFYLIHMFVAFQAFYLLGSVYFARFSFVKTTVIVAALIFGFILYIKMLDKTMLESGYRWMGLTVRSVIPEKVEGIPFYKIYNLPPWIFQTVSMLVKYSWAPVFWIITWKRLAEKEI